MRQIGRFLSPILLSWVLPTPGWAGVSLAADLPRSPTLIEGFLILLLIGGGILGWRNRNRLRARHASEQLHLRQSLRQAEESLRRIEELHRHAAEEVATRKAAEDALLQFEERFSKAFHASSVPIAINTLDQGRFIDANESFRQLTGYRTEELAGRTDLDLGLWPEPIRRPFMLARIRHEGSIRQIEGRIRTRSGEVRLVLVSMERLLLHQEECVLTTLYDITEWKRTEERLRHSEERFQLIARATNDTVWDWDLVTNRIWWNEGIQTVFGYTAAELQTDANWWDQHIHPDDRNRILNGMRQVVDHRERFWSSEYRFARADATYAEVFDRAYVIHDDSGRPVRMLGAMMDITERKRFLTELAMARDAAVEALRLKSEFLANISHEVRTPLNGIVGMTVLLEDTPLDPEQRSFLETIQSSTDALLTIINDILDFSKIEAGKLHFELLDFDLRSTLDSTIELLADRAQSKHIELVSLIDADVPDRLRGDPGRVRQVITNLMVNALKFTEHGEVVLQVSRASESDSHAVLLFTVRDTGIGIPKEALPYLFQAFSQVDGSTTRKHGGTGLGLTISKQLVELMGGQIGVESTAGEGSTFWFTVRLEKQTAAGGDSTHWGTTFAEARVLLASPKPAIRRLLQTSVATLGAESATAASGDEALEILRRSRSEGRPIDLAVLDLELPGADGLQVAQQFQSEPGFAKCPILLLAPRGHSGDTTFLRANGVTCLLRKPLRGRLLLESMARLLDNPGPHQTRFWLDRRPRAQSGMLAPLLGSPRPCRILVAEDNPINQRVALALLEKLGCKAQAVATGPEVLRALEAVNYDLVLMDCQLPEIDGFEATREIRRREQDATPPRRSRAYIIAMTAMAQPGARERCLAAGMDDYLSKPIRIEALTSALRKAITDLPATFSREPATPWPPAIPAPATSAVDPAALEALRQLRSPSRPDPLAEMVAMFLRQAPACIQEIALSITRYEAKTVELAAHNLKGSAGTLGAHALADLCGRLEEEAQRGSLQVATHLLNQVRVEFSKVREVLQKL